MQILVPISASDKFYPEDEYFFPKPLVDVAGRPMIDVVVSQLRASIDDAKFVFVALQDHVRKYSLDKTLGLVAGPDSIVIQKYAETHGGLCACMLAIDALDMNAPLVICNSDQVIDDNLQKHLDGFRARNADAGVVTFNSVHPRWSYLSKNQDGDVAQAFEKQVVSNTAIAGFYYFKTAQQFIDAAQKAILNNDHTNDNYYISAAINQVILQTNNVVFSKLPSRAYHSFFSPDRIEEFNSTPLATKVRHAGSTSDQVRVNVVIPAAGEGSRFAKAGWKNPKPFIDVNGKPMLAHVMENVAPDGYNSVLLLRGEHIDQCEDIVSDLKSPQNQIRVVDRLTEGTACTVLLARDIIDDDTPMMVANSDQLVDFDVNDYVADCLNRGLDGSILVFRDSEMNPKWSFAKTDENGLVTEVAEKNPISDLATVGIYFFTKGSDFVNAAIDMIVNNDRVNNEFYTCPVYNYMIKAGLKIGVYEVQESAMKGLGLPEDLNGYLTEISAPPSNDEPR